MPHTDRRLGVAVVGLGGAVASTAIAGIELLRRGEADTTGLPLAEFDHPDLVGYERLAFGGWDLYDDDVAAALKTHRVLDHEQIEAASEGLAGLKPWPAVGDANFCRNIHGTSVVNRNSKRAQVEAIQDDLKRFREEVGGNIVMLNLASTERPVDTTAPAFRSIEAFEAALDDNDPEISPAILYAYAAISMGVPYGNFTPSVAVDVPALLALAEKNGVPVAGRDGKTGQTLMKTILAPALRARALKVDGWYSTNILGNRDGEALDDADSLASKINTKGDVLNSMLGYPVGAHKVQIVYYPPRGDDKEAWDNIDVTGFLGRKMQIKVNFLCRDSVLAAPLAIEIARCLDLAKQRGEGGAIEPLGVFFKAPITADGCPPVHAFPEQVRQFEAWLDVPAKTEQPLPEMIAAK